MKVGVFSVIPWRFLDQRPQVIAKKLAKWGHEATYFGTFSFDHCSPDIEAHDWEKYKAKSWEPKEIAENLTIVHPLMMPAHKWFKDLMYLNEEFIKDVQSRIIELGIEFGIVVDPLWGKILKEINIPFMYDHVDDTHHMAHVIKDFFYDEAVYCENNSIKNIYIQPNIAERYSGMYIPNGISLTDLVYKPEVEKIYDAVCLSCIADWFDMESVLNTKKKILLIGPMSIERQDEYYKYRSEGGRNVEWIPELPRKLASLWLNKAKVGIIPFDEDHGIVDYVMPLKIVEYYYLGLASVSYVNKGVMDEFGEDHVHSYSSSGWLGYPDLDAAIENAINDKRVEERITMSKKYSWDDVMEPLKLYIENYVESNRA